jgi:hypothetical protein
MRHKRRAVSPVPKRDHLQKSKGTTDDLAGWKGPGVGWKGGSTYTRVLALGHSVWQTRTLKAQRRPSGV